MDQDVQDFQDAIRAALDDAFRAGLEPPIVLREINNAIQAEGSYLEIFPLSNQTLAGEI